MDPETEAEAEFILWYISELGEKTKTCIGFIKRAIQLYPPLASDSIGTFVINFLSKKKPVPPKNCIQYVKDALEVWKTVKPNTNSELQIIKNIKALELGYSNTHNENLKKFVRGARNLPPAGSPAMYASPPAGPAASRAVYKRGIHNTPQRPNPFPGINPLGISTVDHLNRFIEDQFSGHLGDEAERTIPIGLRVGSVHKKYQAYEFAKYFIMHSSSDNSDCLLHTLLTSTCPAFRRLSSEDKNIVANWVRLYLIPAHPVFQEKLRDKRKISEEKKRTHEWLGGETFGEELKLRFFSPGQFLDDTDIDILKDTFNITILVFENQARSPQTVALLGSRSPVYMFMNKEGAHYEAVKTLEPGGSYTIPLETANKIVLIIRERVIKESVQDMRNANAIRATMISTFGIPLGNSNSAPTLKGEVGARIEEAKRDMRSVGPLPNFSNQTRKNHTKKPILSFKTWLKTQQAKKLLANGFTEENLRASYQLGGGGSNRNRSTRKAGHK